MEIKMGKIFSSETQQICVFANTNMTAFHVLDWAFRQVKHLFQLIVWSR